MTTYRINGLGPGLDGLYVESDEDIFDYLEIKKISSHASIIGDRDLSISLPKGALLIDRDYLDLTDDPAVREFDVDFPYGNEVSTTEMRKGVYNAVVTIFERAVGVTLIRSGVGSPVYDPLAREFRSSSDKTVSSFYIDTSFPNTLTVVASRLGQIFAEFEEDQIPFALEEMKQEIETTVSKLRAEQESASNG